MHELSERSGFRVTSLAPRLRLIHPATDAQREVTVEWFGCGFGDTITTDWGKAVDS
jgi:hypothetical protein